MSQEFDNSSNYGSNLDFMPAESWRILRIMSEFVESFCLHKDLLCYELFSLLFRKV